MIAVSAKFIRVYLPALLYMVAIFISSCFHHVPLPFIDRLSVDKIYHGLEYLVLGYLVLRALEQGFLMYGGWMVVLGIFIATIYGISDEVHQLYVPGRYFGWWDLTADAVGSALGCWVYLKIRF
jgi:VanZ family protein